jgi:hypothetical protein
MKMGVKIKGSREKSEIPGPKSKIRKHLATDKHG